MRFELTILGCNAAIPAYDRHPSAQVLHIHEKLFLIDCGEGTQIQMNRFKIRRNRIHQIFISHLHGDHIFGLIGLLTSYSLNGRKEPMHIYSPEGLEAMIEIQLKHSQSFLSYSLHFHTVDTKSHQLIFEDDSLTVHSIPLKHRIPTSGYLFREKPRTLNLIPEQLTKYDIPFTEMEAIKQGQDYITPAGQVIANQELTFPPFIPRSFAYCSDTIYDEALVPMIQKVDLLYHETTFCQDKEEQAKQTMHSTALQAAHIARMAEVGQLVTGHYSSRYTNLEVVLAEALTGFEHTVLGIEGNTYSVEARRAER